jgi:hypothetical protein
VAAGGLGAAVRVTKADLRLLAECGPYTVESRADGLLTVTPAWTTSIPPWPGPHAAPPDLCEARDCGGRQHSGGVATRMALARVVAEALNTLTTHPLAQKKARRR